MSTFAVQNFLNEITTRGLAKQNRFLVEINNVNFSSELDERILPLFCQSASLPGATISVQKQSLFGPDYIRPTNINYGDSLSMSFLCDKDMLIKKMFDLWIHSIVNMSSFTVNYKEKYARDIVVSQLDEKENITYSVKLVDAFPVQIGSLSVSQTAIDRLHILPVTFAYRYWETEDIGNSDLYESEVAGPQELTKAWGPKIPTPPL